MKTALEWNEKCLKLLTTSGAKQKSCDFCYSDRFHFYIYVHIHLFLHELFWFDTHLFCKFLFLCELFQINSVSTRTLSTRILFNKILISCIYFVLRELFRFDMNFFNIFSFYMICINLILFLTESMQTNLF